MPKLRRRLPPELLAEIHKCLPLADAINVLVNVPTRAIYQNNSPRMRRTIQRIKTSLNEYVATFYESAEENEIEDMVVYSDELKWKPEMDALLRYGKWMTTKRKLLIGARGNNSGSIVGVPENFVENLLLHLSNSSSTQIMLERVQIKFGRAKRIALPKFLKQLFSAKNQYRIGGRIFFEPIELKAENGQILCIHDGEMVDEIFGSGGYELKLIVVNKMDRKKWFNISLIVNSSRKFIRSLRWKLQALDDIAELMQIDSFKQNYNYNKINEEQNIYWNYRLDMFLRRGSIFSQFRHFNFKIKEPSLLNFYPHYYADFLFNYISNTKYPEEFLESVDINFEPEPNYSALFDDEFWKDCYKYKFRGIPKGGKYINSADKKKLHILSIKTAQSDNKLEFTLANIPTKGAYEFDVDLQFVKGPTQIIGIKIQRRKNGDIAELECQCQHEIELGKKRKAINDNGDGDQPTYSRKIIRK